MKPIEALAPIQVPPSARSAAPASPQDPALTQAGTFEQVLRTRRELRNLGAGLRDLLEVRSKPFPEAPPAMTVAGLRDRGRLFERAPAAQAAARLPHERFGASMLNAMDADRVRKILGAMPAADAFDLVTRCSQRIKTLYRDLGGAAGRYP